MKVRCIDIRRSEEITLGKVYNVMVIDGSFYIIINDVGKKNILFK